MDSKRIVCDYLQQLSKLFDYRKVLQLNKAMLK